VGWVLALIQQLLPVCRGLELWGAGGIIKVILVWNYIRSDFKSFWQNSEFVKYLW